VTDVLEDTQNRRWVMAACDDVTPRKKEEVTRREFMARRRSFAESQVMLATRQSFTLEALKDRYHYVQPGRQEERKGDGQPPGGQSGGGPKPGDDGKPGDGKPGDGKSGDGK
jgi:hypothetical protein